MNKLILILATIFLTVSCKEEPQPAPVVYEQKYFYGTVMYAKPDSLKVVILEFDSSDNTYKAYWREGAEYANAWYSEEGFYGEVTPSETVTKEETYE